MTIQDVRISRREAINLLGVGAGLGIVTALRGESSLAAAGPQAAAAGARQVTFPQGAIIRTVLQDVSPETVGTGATLFHEHLSLTDPRGWNAIERAALPRSAGAEWPFYMDDLDFMVEEVRAAAQDGVSCIVDAGGEDLGRSVENLKTIATRVPQVHIVACGGLHTQPRYPIEIHHMTEDQVADWFAQDATAERWGALGEIGMSATMHPEELKVHRAVGKVHVRTGLPILTHTQGANYTDQAGCKTCGVEQLDAFESVGVDPRVVAIGHLNDIRDDPQAEGARAIAGRGAFVGFDHSGNPGDPRTDEHIKMILAVLEAGYEDQVLLSSDFFSENLTKREGGPGIGLIVTTFVPKLKAAGVNEATLHKIMVDNPRRLLAFVPK